MPKTNGAAVKKRTRKTARRIPEDLFINRRREHRFNLPLPAVVQGRSPDGTPFFEKSSLHNISSTGAFFFLDSAIVIGSKIQVLIDLPRTLTEKKDLKLSLNGAVTRLTKSEDPSKKQGVALRFTKKIRFFASDQDK